MKRAILLSGGQDSIALAALIRPSLAITVNYGQIAALGEMDAAAAVAAHFEIPHTILKADCAAVGSGDMANSDSLRCSPTSDWWPYRNQLIITLGASIALAHGMTSLAIASVANDASHVDGRKEFFSALDQLIQMQEGGLRIEAPAVEITSAELVRRSGIGLDVLAWAHSCHTGSTACGICRGCNKHRDVLRDLGYDSY